MELFRVKYDEHNGKPRLRAWEKGMPMFHITHENHKNRQFLVRVSNVWHIVKLSYNEHLGYILILNSTSFVMIDKQTKIYLLPNSY